MNYDQMSDFEINRAVAGYLGLDAGKALDPRDYDLGEWLNMPSRPTPLDYCNNPADAWPIITEHGISLSAWQNGKDWTAWFAGKSMEYCAPEFSHASDNPLRSAMIIYLMMKETPMPHKYKPLDDLEMFELLQAAYPGRFPDEGGDESWEAAQEFIEELSGFDEIADLLGRVVMLSMPMESGLTKRLSHCLGTVTIKQGSAQMMAAVRRDAVEETTDAA